MWHGNINGTFDRADGVKSCIQVSCKSGTESFPSMAETRKFIFLVTHTDGFRESSQKRTEEKS